MSQSKIVNQKLKIVKLFIMLGLGVVLVIILTYRFLWEEKPRVTPLSSAKSSKMPEYHPDLILKDIEGLLTENNQEIGREDVQKPINSSLKRDLFSPGILLHTKAETLSKEEKEREDNNEENRDNRIEDMIKELKLKATIINNQRPISIINDKIVGIGEDIMGFKVIEIKDGVVFLSNGKEHISLNMKGKNNETLQ